MSTETPPMVLAGIDGSAMSAAVADYAAWIAMRIDAPLKLLHNLEHPALPLLSDLSGSIGMGSQEQLLQELTELEAKRSHILLAQGKHMLAMAAQRARAMGINEPLLSQRHGGFIETLIALESSIRILVVGLRGESVQPGEGHVGHHLEGIIRALHKPILVVNSDFVVPRRIMLAYDGSEAARKALAMLEASPFSQTLEIHLVSVADDNASANRLLEEASRTLEIAGRQPKSAVLNGNAEQQLLHYQRQNGIDMIVMGAFGRSRLREILFGSFTLKMLQHAQIPLLLLR